MKFYVEPKFEYISFGTSDIIASSSNSIFGEIGNSNIGVGDDKGENE